MIFFTNSFSAESNAKKYAIGIKTHKKLAVLAVKSKIPLKWKLKNIGSGIETTITTNNGKIAFVNNLCIGI